MVRVYKSPRGRNGRDSDDKDDGNRFALTRAALLFRRAANDNRLNLKGWAQRVFALALLIGLAALLVLKIAG